MRSVLKQGFIFAYDNFCYLVLLIFRSSHLHLGLYSWPRNKKNPPAHSVLAVCRDTHIIGGGGGGGGIVFYKHISSLPVYSVV